MDNRYRNFLSSIRYLIWIFLIGIALFLISRLVFLFVYGDLNELTNNLTDVIYAFVVGFKFDFKVLCFALLPLAVLCLFQLFNANRRILYGFYYRMSLFYGLLVLITFTVISVIDFYFFKFFDTRISVLFFGLIEDAPNVVLKSVWANYPILLILLSLTILSVLFFLLLKWLFRKEIKWVYIQSSWLKAFTVILFLGVYFLGLRGSIGLKPLNIHHASISKNTFINALTLNGVFSLNNAYFDKKESQASIDIPDMLKRYGFNSPREAIEKYLDGKINDSIKLSDNLLSTTPQDSFLAKNPPNVVFILMESMNGYYIDMNTPETNVLGKLGDELPNCYVFRNFLPASKEGIYSLEEVLTGNTLAPISQSGYQNRSLSSSVAKPFKERGYVTSFVTGGETTIDKFICHQYFDNVEGESTLKKLYPNATICESGIDDEYTFNRIFQLLKDAKGKSQFIVGFAISNSSPYETPKTYKPYPLTITDEIKTKLKTSPEIAYDNLLACQYSSSCLGQFIDEIRNSPLGENTIVVVTGDHANLQLFDFSDNDFLKKYSVPLIIYSPVKYKPKHNIDTSKFGSHKDIFPTIFNLALSNTTYLNTGTNLLGENSSDNFGIYCYNLAMNSKGCVNFQSSPIFFSWESDSTRSLLPIEIQPNPPLDSLYLKGRAYAASMNYFIMSKLKSKKVGE